MMPKGMVLFSTLLLATAMFSLPTGAAEEARTCDYDAVFGCTFPVADGDNVTVTAVDLSSDHVPIQYCDAAFTACVTSCGSLTILGAAEGTIFVGDTIATADALLTTAEVCTASIGAATAIYT